MYKVNGETLKTSAAVAREQTDKHQLSTYTQTYRHSQSQNDIYIAMLSILESGA